MTDTGHSKVASLFAGLSSAFTALGPLPRALLLGIVSGTASYLLGLLESRFQTSFTLISPALCFAAVLLVAFADRRNWKWWTFLWLAVAIYAAWYAANWVGAVVHRDMPSGTSETTKMLVAGLAAGLIGAAGTYLAVCLLRLASPSIRAAGAALLTGMVLGGALLAMQQMGWLLFSVWQTGVLIALHWSHAPRPAAIPAG